MADVADAWLDRIVHSPAVTELCKCFDVGNRAVANGSIGSSTTLLGGALSTRLNRFILLVVAHLDDADDALEDLRYYAASADRTSVTPEVREVIAELERLTGA